MANDKEKKITRESWIFMYESSDKWLHGFHKNGDWKRHQGLMSRI